MQIVLRSDMDKVGRRGDIVEVSDGYARNFLIPRGHAILATEGITRQANAMRSARDRSEAKNREAAQSVADGIAGKSLRLEARAGEEGKLFGSVTTADISSALKSQVDVELDRKHIELGQPIRSLGSYKAILKLHADVHVNIDVEVVAAQEES
jgi:large subunit ribosomal protein L9